MLNIKVFWDLKLCRSLNIYQ